MKTISIILILAISSVCCAQDLQVSDVIEQQYENELRKKLPMDPKQIKKFKKRVLATTRAIRPPVPKNFRAQTRQLVLEPGAKSPEVVVTPNFVTGLSFFDVTGEPWPITSATPGHPKWFSIIRPELEPGNFITVSPLANFATSNIIITLKDWPYPVMIALATSDTQHSTRSTDGNIAFRADKRGPYAKEPIIGEYIESPVSDELLGFLDAVPPRDALRLEEISKRNGVELWQYDKNLYLRTYHTLLWPAWDGTVRGVNGVMLYRLPIVKTIMLSENGKKTTLRVK